MAKDATSLRGGGGATMIGVRCRRRDRHRCLSVARLLAQYGPDESLRHIMRAQIGE